MPPCPPAPNMAVTRWPAAAHQAAANGAVGRDVSHAHVQAHSWPCMLVCHTQHLCWCRRRRPPSEARRRRLVARRGAGRVGWPASASRHPPPLNRASTPSEAARGAGEQPSMVPDRPSPRGLQPAPLNRSIASPPWDSTAAGGESALKNGGRTRQAGRTAGLLALLF